MKKKSFFNKDQAQSYLSSSLIRVDGRPAYVLDVTRKVYQGKYHLSLNYYDILDEGRTKTARISSYRVDLNPVPLGLFTYKGNLLYASRIPVRKWKIGLSVGNFKAFNCCPVNRDDLFYNGDRYSSVIGSKSLAKTIMGEFPSVSFALEETGEIGSCLPFSRRFGIYRGEYLIYKSQREFVGTLKYEANKIVPTLVPKFAFLNEALVEDMRE